MSHALDNVYTNLDNFQTVCVISQAWLSAHFSLGDSFDENSEVVRDLFS